MCVRSDVQIPCGGDTVAAWLYPAQRTGRLSEYPAIVMAHGLGGVKEFGLDAYCERFSQAGYICIAFDYRHWGASTGEPRGLIDIEREIYDWNTVIQYTAQLPQVDAARIAVFGTSLSGGYAIRLAATNPLVKCAVCQCPFTNGLASANSVGYLHAMRMLFLALWDAFFSWPTNPVRIPLIAPPGEFAMENSFDAYQGYRAMLPPGKEEADIREVPARIVLQLPFSFPGTYAKHVKGPIFFAICADDTVTPPATTLHYAKQAPKGTVRVYEGMGHFAVITREGFERVVPDYVAFLQENL